jgi:hypothetical protein
MNHQIDNIVPKAEFLELEEDNNKIFDREMFKIGVGYLVGCGLGAFSGIKSGFSNSKGSPVFVRMKMGIYEIPKVSIKTANQFAVMRKKNK